MTLAQKLIGLLALILVLMAGTATSAWKVQDWRYGKQLVEQAGLHQDDLTAISNAALPRFVPIRKSAWRSNGECRPATKPTTRN